MTTSRGRDDLPPAHAAGRSQPVVCLGGECPEAIARPLQIPLPDCRIGAR
jgi:hypothetical protein